jgi:hypothetical protein
MFIKDVPTFIAGEPLAARRMAKINTGVTDTVPPTIVYCGVTGIPHMVTQYSKVTNEKIACDMFPFSLAVYEVEVTISTAIVVGTALYMAANGMLTDHKTTNAYGVAIAFQQAAASGDHIAVMPLGFTYVTGA